MLYANWRKKVIFYLIVVFCVVFWSLCCVVEAIYMYTYFLIYMSFEFCRSFRVPLCLRNSCVQCSLRSVRNEYSGVFGKYRHDASFFIFLCFLSVSPVVTDSIGSIWPFYFSMPLSSVIVFQHTIVALQHTDPAEGVDGVRDLERSNHERRGAEG